MLDNGNRGTRDVRARTKVRIGEVAAEAYRSVFGRLGLFLDLAWLPLLLMLAAVLIPGLVSGYLMPEAAASPPNGGHLSVTGGEILKAILAILCLNAFAVRWHHAALLPNPHRVPPGLFSRAWSRFLLYTVVFNLSLAALTAVMLVSGAAGGALAGSGGAFLLVGAVAAALTVAIGLGMMRCSLLLPAAAFGRPLRWTDAWRLMRGNTWRLIAATVLACVPVVMAVLLLLDAVLAAAHLGVGDVLPSGRLPLGAFILHGLVGTLLNFVTVALAASVLSGFYRRLVLRGGA